MGFFKSMLANVQTLVGADDTAFQTELQEQQSKTQYLSTPDRDCDCLLDINEVIQRAPKCVLEPITPSDLKVQLFGFYDSAEFDNPALFISIVNQSEFVYTPSEKRTNFLKFGEFYQKVTFSQLNLKGISLSATHGLTDIEPGEAIMLVCHGDFTTYNPRIISLTLNYDKNNPDDKSLFTNVTSWVCQNHPIIT